MGNFTECTEDVITDTDGHGARLLAVQARRELDASNVAWVDRLLGGDRLDGTSINLPTCTETS
ncbi:hypothetical protein T492DRAFT_902203 [Pavlovales sp. CCMP2436]|nr:hypothetical protein T492DRAFT_902203 [Pavlovales sp. CCMP2436]